jgi:hypothetical protein
MIEGDKRTNPELLTDTSYEPLWSFTAKDEDGSYLPPVLPVLKEVIRVFKTVTSSKSDAEEAERKQDEADIKRDVEILEEEGSTPITSHLSMGSGIIVPRNYE